MRDDEFSPRSRRRLGALHWLAIIGGSVILLAIIVLVWSKVSLTRSVEAELARIRMSGEPTSAMELEDYYQRPPADRDATGTWLTAFSAFDGPEFREAAQELPIVGTGESPIPLPPETWAQLESAERLLDKYQNSLQLLHDAAEKGGDARYPTDFRRGFQMNLNHVNSMRVAARMLALECQVRAHRADPGGAARSIRAIFSFARSLENEPLIISQLVRMACDSIGRQQLREMLSVVGFPKDDLIRLQTDLRNNHYDKGLQRGLVGERVMGIIAFRNPGLVGMSRPQAVAWSLTRGTDFRAYLEFMNDTIKAARQPFPGALREAERAEADVMRRINGASRLARARYALTALMKPALKAAFIATARNTAQKRAAEVAISLELYRRAQGTLPTALDQLVPEFLPRVPTDPFDGQPFRYVARGREFVVYSVGSDRTDDGGKADEQNRPDVVFRVEAPREEKVPQ